MRIGIDIDDTISNTLELSQKYVEKFIKDDLHREIVKSDDIVTSHDYIKNIYKLNEKEEFDFWKKYFILITKEVVPKPDSVRIINKLKEEGNKIIIVTARWDQEGFNAEKDSAKWLKNNEIKFDKIIVKATESKEKAKVAKKEKLDLFIDDSVQNCEEVSKYGIKSFLFTTKPNKNYKIKNATRVYSWKEIYEKIREEK